MKKVWLLASLMLACLLTGCEDTHEYVLYEINEPVFMSAVEFRKAVTVSEVPRAIKQQGKLCFYEGYLYISEPGVGFHIIDNRNPANPSAVGFVELLGNVDIAIRDNRLYADALVDLLWFDISNPAKPAFQGRLENVFAEALPQVNNMYGYDYQMCTDGRKDKVIVGWSLAMRREKTDKYSRWAEKGLVFDSSPGMYASNSATGGSGRGVNGSMSRFGQYDKYLYTVVNGELGVFDISGSEPAKLSEQIFIGNVETIFSYKDYLFMGMPTGMMIFSVANPLKPEYMSSMWHVYGCDPVVVEDDLAYVTIHSDNFCGQNANELLIVDVSDVKHPKHLVTYGMTKPKGLGIDNGTLFVCDEGLKIYKIGDPQQLMANRLVHYTGMEGYDVIPFQNTLMMIAEDGLYQYSYSDLGKISQISKLSIGK